LRLPVPELLLTGVLAAGFAAVGEITLRRLSRSLAGANESMLVGMGVCAAALFPLSLALPRRALAAEAMAIGACLAWAVLRRLRASRPGTPPKPPPPDPAARWALAAAGLVAAGFAALNFRYTYLWDGFLIWATKAQLLFHEGGLTREWFAGDLYDLRHLEYPSLVALCEALVSLLRGGFDFDGLKPVFMLFFLSLMVGTYSAVRSAGSPRLAAMATLLVCLVPAVSTHTAAGALSDMPQAAVVAGVTAAAMAGRREALPWLIGALTTVKAEGTILAVLACLGVLLFFVLEDRGVRFRRFAAEKAGLAIVGSFFVLRLLYIRWIHAPYDVYGGGVSVALARVPLVAGLCLRELVDPRRWGLFWPAFALACAPAFAAGSNREKSAAAAVAAGLVVLATPFLVTTWPVELQIEQAYYRLAAQLSPAAATVMALAWATARDRLNRPAVRD
jgi:hypothetical protein